MSGGMDLAEYLAYVPNDIVRGFLLRGLTGGGVFLSFNYIDLCKHNLYDAVLFSQIMYWADINLDTKRTRMTHLRDGHLWIVKTHDEWAKEVHFDKPSTVGKCLRRLSNERGLIIAETHKSPFHNLQLASYVRPHWENFAAALVKLNTESDSQSLSESYSKSLSENHSELQSEDDFGSSSENDLKSRTLFTETTPETTSENTTDITDSTEIGVGAVITQLALAKIRFNPKQFEKRHTLVAEAIQQYGLANVQQEIKEAKAENAQRWSYVANRLEARHIETDEGLKYITGKYADYIDH